MLPTLFSSSVAQLNLIVGTVFASLLATGSQTWLYLSDRLIEFPLGLFGGALGTVILPHLSSRVAAVDDDGYRSEENTSELQSLMSSSYAVFCLKKQLHTTII